MSGLDSILHRRAPSFWENLRSSPLLCLTMMVYQLSQPHRNAPSSASDAIYVVCISDTHSSHRSQPQLPEGDILIHSGDLSHSGTAEELYDALDWLHSQPYLHKVFIAGNHDLGLADAEIRERISSKYIGLTYLDNESVALTLRGRTLHIHGSPYTPKHGSWPFQYPRALPSLGPSELSIHPSTAIWSCIPPQTDILITHGPPFAHLDHSLYGCYSLLQALWRIRPRIHVCGHIHVARGVAYLKWDAVQKTYEDICAGKAGWIGLVKLLWWSTVARIGALFQTRSYETTLINAAAIGGSRDEKKHGAIVVTI